MIHAEHEATAIHLDVSPPQSLIDEPVSIRLSGLAADQFVTLHAEMKDGNLLTWEAAATFRANAQGEVDVSTQQPTEGSYAEVDAMGLFWSMRMKEEPANRYFSKSKATPLIVTLTAAIDGTPLTSVTIKRIFAAPGVKMVPLQEPGLVGTLFLPAESGPHPAVVLLNGSDGGYREYSAALLASRGYAALALAYFGSENCPEHLVAIPLEYFENALTWLKAQENIDGEKLGVIGLSRGGELALLLGATFPAIKAVVACSPSGLVHAGLKNYRSVPQSAWSYQGEQLPYVSAQSSRLRGFVRTTSFVWKVLRHKPVRLLDVFRPLMKDATPETIERATIPVEKTNGPVLLISGQDDQLWPASQFSEMVIARLQQHNHPYPFRHLSYEEVGHFVCFPYTLPSFPPSIVRARAGMTSLFGGSPQASAAAANDAWLQILGFLGDSLRGERTG